MEPSSPRRPKKLSALAGEGVLLPKAHRRLQNQPGGQPQPLQHWLTNRAKLSGLPGLSLSIANGRDKDSTTEGCQVEESK